MMWKTSNVPTMSAPHQSQISSCEYAPRLRKEGNSRVNVWTYDSRRVWWLGVMGILPHGKKYSRISQQTWFYLCLWFFSPECVILAEPNDIVFPPNSNKNGFNFRTYRATNFHYCEFVMRYPLPRKQRNTSIWKSSKNQKTICALYSNTLSMLFALFSMSLSNSIPASTHQSIFSTIHFIITHAW